jgi:hypothetical protein
MLAGVVAAPRIRPASTQYLRFEISRRSTHINPKYVRAGWNNFRKSEEQRAEI